MGIQGIANLVMDYDEWPLYAERVSMTDAPKNSDDTDVDEALKRETQDGSGFQDSGELPDSDFEGFPEDEVENNHDGDNEPAVEGTDVQ